MRVHRAAEVSDEWGEIRAELERAFRMSREAARAEESFVYVVHQDDLLGRHGAGNAMVACGLLSAARSAALEGARKGWTANVVAYEEGVTPEQVDRWVERMLDTADVTGELIRIGPSHLGKALP